MKGTVLILRPQPGADETAARAAALGLEPVVAPLFQVRPLPWKAPSEAVDALMLTSANALRYGGPSLQAFAGLPCYAVGEATAQAAREAGLEDVRTGSADGAALLSKMAAQGVTTALHLCGRDRLELTHAKVRTLPLPVYASDAVGELPRHALQGLSSGAVALIHSPRAGALFSALMPRQKDSVEIAAISAAAAEAVGPGWKRVAVAARPRDEALLELAVKLCQTGADD